MTTLFQVVVYPGALWVGGFVALLALILGTAQDLRLRTIRSASFATQLSLALVATTLALLPWPRSPVAPVFTLDLWRIWAFSEASLLLALLPGLAAQDGTMHRAAVHAAQISVAGRVALWVAVLAALGNNSPIALAPAGAAVLVALPFAAGWLTTQALPQSSFLHAVHSILLIALVVSFMVNTPTLPWWQQLGLKLAAAMALASVGRRLRGKGIRRAETALRICFFVALPLAVLASVIR